MKRRHFFKISLPFVIPCVAVEACAPRDLKPTLTFGVIADPQYADQPARGQRHYRESLEKLKRAIDDLNQHHLDFVVTLGDVIDADFTSFKAIMPLYRALKAPHQLVLGNHDFDVADQDKGKVMQAMGMPKAYYSETHGPWRFIYLDGTEVSTYRYPADDPRTSAAEQRVEQLKKQTIKQAHPWNGAISEDQMTWLKNELVAASSANQQVIVFCHYPVYPVDGHNLWNAEEVVELISQYPNVKAYMNGHHHKGNYGEHKGCHYVNFKGMVETKDASAYAVVSCFHDRIEVDGFETEPDRKLF